MDTYLKVKVRRMLYSETSKFFLLGYKLDKTVRELKYTIKSKTASHRRKRIIGYF